MLRVEEVGVSLFSCVSLSNAASGGWLVVGCAPAVRPPRHRRAQRESPAKTIAEAELFSGGCYDGA
jgi:hypothetical protein